MCPAVIIVVGWETQAPVRSGWGEDNLLEYFKEKEEWPNPSQSLLPI